MVITVNHPEKSRVTSASTEYIKANQYVMLVAFFSLLPCGPRMAVVPLTLGPHAEQDADSGCGRGSGTSRPQESAHRGSLAGGVDSVLAARDLVAPWHGSLAGGVGSVLTACDLVAPWHGSLAGDVGSVLTARDLVAPWHVGS